MTKPKEWAKHYPGPANEWAAPSSSKLETPKRCDCLDRSLTKQCVLDEHNTGPHDFAEAPPKPAESEREYKVGQVVWHEGYERYMQICSIVYEGTTKKHHSYIVPAWNTKGTIQVHPERIRTLTSEEIGVTSSPELPRQT